MSIELCTDLKQSRENAVPLGAYRCDYVHISFCTVFELIDDQ